METQLLHEHENNEKSLCHLKDNGKKFSRHCNIVLSLMYQGRKLTARQLEREFNIDGRRLRDIYANRKECKREWTYNAEGGTNEMQYWLDIPKPPTKDDLQQWFREYQEEQGQVISIYKYQQQDLFQ